MTDTPRSAAPKLGEVADRIYSHLKRIESDPILNPRIGGKNGTPVYWNVNARAAGSRVGITYVSYQGERTLTKQEALAYLAWLDAGNVGKHWKVEAQASEGKHK
jgi:hypothetical protein